MSKTSDIMKELKAKKNVDVSLLSDPDSPCNVTEWLSTGCLALDAIMGGGLPIGRVTEMYGENSSGKSLIATQVAALAQANGVTVGYVDTESAVSKEMMEILGVKLDELVYTSPDTVEEVFTFFQDMVDAKEKVAEDSILLLIWDSIAATSAMQEMDADPGKANYGIHAKVISQGFRKFCREISKKRVCVLALNQIRQKIGVMYGDNVATFGGLAMSFHASVRVELDVVSKIKIDLANKKKRIVGMNTKAIVKKNKVAVPFREATLPIHFGSGIDDAASAFLYLLDNEFLTRKGIAYTMKIGDEEITATKSSWSKIFDKHYDAIANIILSHKPDMFGSTDNDDKSEQDPED